MNQFSRVFGVRADIATVERPMISSYNDQASYKVTKTMKKIPDEEEKNPKK